MLIQLALAFAVTLLPQASTSLTAQDITIVAPESWCSEPLDSGFFGPNEMNGWFCKDYLLALAAAGLGFEEHTIIAEWTSTWSAFDVARYFDDKVRDELLGQGLEGSCTLDNKKFLACYERFGACNIVDGPGIFEDVGLCRETCVTLSRCTGSNCALNPEFDSTNTTHCVATVAVIEAAAPSLGVPMMALAFVNA